MAKRRKSRKKKETANPPRPAEPRVKKVEPTSRSRKPALALAVFALAGAATFLWFWRAAPSLPAPQPLNVVVVTADTLRADRLGAYGASSPETPHLDRLSAGGVLFEEAYTTAPITLPAHASIFTGAYPIAHGVHENGGRPLATERTTLAETLRDAGYRTGAFVGAFVLDERWGLGQGFERYGDDVGEGVERRGEEVLDEALEWMDTVRDERFFSWIHLFDPHVPYDPPEPFASRHGPSDEGLYDGEVAYVDALVGRLLDWLDARDLAESTLIVFVGDHGESLGEHGELTHGFFVYGATMRVPLILRAPSLDEGARVEAQVRVIDVMPTVLELLGVSPPGKVQGASLVALATRERDERDRPSLGESIAPRHYGWSELVSLRTNGLHFIDAPRPELYDLEVDPGETENLASTRAATVREMKDRLDTLARELQGDETSSPTETVSAESMEKLAALGYLGSGTAPRLPPDAELADPKDKIGVFNRIREAAAAIDAGEPEAALELLESVVEEDPDVVEAYNLIGKANASLGRTQSAVRAFERALERNPTYAPVAARLARIHLDARRYERALAILDGVDAPGLEAEALMGAGRREEALRIIDDALDSSAPAGGVHYLKALLLASEGNVTDAVPELEQEVSLTGDYRAHFELAKILRQQGRGTAAIEHLEKSVDSSPGFAVGHLYLADALLEAGELERSVEHALEGLSLGPEPALAPLGHFVLADAYGRLGRAEDAAREMEIASKLAKSAGGPPK